MTRRVRWLVLALLTGCVSGEPFAPEMCVVYSDSLTVRLPADMLSTCALPRIETEVRR